MTVPGIPRQSTASEGPDRQERLASAGRLAFSVALFAAPAWCWAAASGPGRWLILPLVIAAQAVAVAGVSNAAHEAVHSHLWRRRSSNLFWGRVLHGVLLLDHDIHRRYHLAHHAHLGDAGDPEGQFGFADLGGRRGYVTRTLRWAVPPSPLHLANWREAVRQRSARLQRGVAGTSGSFGSPVGPVVAVAVIVLWAFWFSRSPIDSILVGVVPLAVSGPLLGWATALPEHVGLAEQAPDRRTRNIQVPRPLQFALWNFNLHATHHSYPFLHFRALPGAAAECPAEFVASGYVDFHCSVWRELSAVGR